MLYNERIHRGKIKFIEYYYFYINKNPYETISIQIYSKITNFRFQTMFLKSNNDFKFQNELTNL